MAFTDDPILPGVTPVRDIHFAELGERIRLAHLVELREALAAAYEAARRATPSWIDAVLMTGTTPIKAAHLIELRGAVLALQ